MDISFWQDQIITAVQYVKLKFDQSEEFPKAKRKDISL